MNNTIIYLSIYLLPMAILMAQFAPDLELCPMRFVNGFYMPRRWGFVAAWLTIANLGINAFLNLAIEPQGLIVMAAWQAVYLLFAWRVGPWLH